MRSVVEALLGVPLLAEPPVPPEDIAQGYNPILDRARPNDIDHWLKSVGVKLPSLSLAHDAFDQRLSGCLSRGRFLFSKLLIV